MGEKEKKQRRKKTAEIKKQNDKRKRKDEDNEKDFHGLSRTTTRMIEDKEAIRRRPGEQ